MNMRLHWKKLSQRCLMKLMVCTGSATMGPEPRRTGVQEAHSLLRLITGLDGPVDSEDDWIPLIERNGFLGRRWTEQLFDAGQGAVFHGAWSSRSGGTPGNGMETKSGLVK